MDSPCFSEVCYAVGRSQSLIMRSGEGSVANKDQKKRNAKTNKPKLSAKDKKKKKKAAQLANKSTS